MFYFGFSRYKWKMYETYWLMVLEFELSNWFSRAELKYPHQMDIGDLNVEEEVYDLVLILLARFDLTNAKSFLA